MLFSLYTVLLSVLQHTFFGVILAIPVVYIGHLTRLYDHFYPKYIPEYDSCIVYHLTYAMLYCNALDHVAKCMHDFF